MTLTPAQCKMARKLLGWPADVLANKVRLSELDIARFEAGKPGMSFIGTALIRRAFEIAGVQFAEDNGGAPILRREKQSEGRQ
jgi:ribosome-binding protein aMBF1 (putative translation factor)